MGRVRPAAQRPGYRVAQRPGRRAARPGRELRSGQCAAFRPARTVAAFAARLKDAVDLNSIEDDLAAAVHPTLEPAHISVWLSPGASRPASYD